MSVTCQVLDKEAPGSSPAAPLPSQQQLRSFEGRGVRKGEALSLGPSMESLQVILCRAPPTPPPSVPLSLRSAAVNGIWVCGIQEARASPESPQAAPGKPGVLDHHGETMAQERLRPHPTPTPGHSHSFIFYRGSKHTRSSSRALYRTSDPPEPHVSWALTAVPRRKASALAK